MPIIGSIEVPDTLFNELRDNFFIGIVRESFKTNLDVISNMSDIDVKFIELEQQLIEIIKSQTSHTDNQLILNSSEFKDVENAAANAARQKIDQALILVAAEVNAALGINDSQVSFIER